MTWKPHATVAAIIEHDGKFLMVEENVNGEIVCNQPAGHLDPNESLIDAVIRETQEETGWEFIPEALLGVYLWKKPNTETAFLRFAFCGTCSNQQADQKLDDGILRALWLSKEELQNKHNLRSPMVLRNIEDYLSGQRYPLEILTTVDYKT